ncbi:MAG: methyltransferase domain-containing protein [Ruminiclostridium sp.]|nr:methyltransferase domain-containing protein [Ruminiclostridium sp.]
MSKIGNYLASQCGNPHGVIGRIMTWGMNRSNKVLYQGIVDIIDVSDSTKILDIGFGNGYLEKQLIRKGRCSITGIDISEDMVIKAASLNHKYVDSGNMTFRLGDCCDLDFENNSFDFVTTINTIYFWNDTAKGMSEIYRVLKDGGMFCNVVMPKETLDKIFYTKNGFKKFVKDDYIELGSNAGFTEITIKELGNNYGLLIIYDKSQVNKE